MDKKPARRRAQKQPDASEAALVSAFAVHQLVQQRLARRNLELKGTRGGAKGFRIPTSLRAIERRWVVGQLTVKKAATCAKTAQLRAQLAAGEAASDALVGTAALLAMSEDGSGFAELMPMDTRTQLRELRLRVKTRVHGGATSRGTRRTADHKRYFLHQDIVTACLRHARQHGSRQQQRQRAPHMKVQQATASLSLSSPKERSQPDLSTPPHSPARRVPTMRHLDQQCKGSCPESHDWRDDWLTLDDREESIDRYMGYDFLDSSTPSSCSESSDSSEYEYPSFEPSGSFAFDGIDMCGASTPGARDTNDCTDSFLTD